MISNDLIREQALSFLETIEFSHFERVSFRKKKTIFATFSEKERVANFKLTLLDQDFFCSIDKNIIYPVPNKMGKTGLDLCKYQYNES